MSHHLAKRHQGVLIAGIAIVILGLLWVVWQEKIYQDALQVMSPNQGEVVVQIDQGTTPRAVGHMLEEQGLVASGKQFVKYLERNDFDARLRAGAFAISPRQTIVQIADELVNGTGVIPRKITLLEGWTMREIDAHLAGIGLITAGEFLNCAANCDLSEYGFLPAESELREGFWWPATYDIDPNNFDIAAFTKELLYYYDLNTKSLLNGKGRNGWDILKMASIVEKEATSNLEEKRIVAGILWKRLDNNWQLGADATTRYATENFTGELTVAQLQDKNPWNTRAVLGLPPGAINSPGLATIEATVDPIDTEYWYYLHDNAGQIYYAETLAGHNANKRKYLQ